MQMPPFEIFFHFHDLFLGKILLNNRFSAQTQGLTPLSWKSWIPHHRNYKTETETDTDVKRFGSRSQICHISHHAPLLETSGNSSFSET